MEQLCPVCNGCGSVPPGFYSHIGYTTDTVTCRRCHGVGTFGTVDTQQIMDAQADLQSALGIYRLSIDHALGNGVLSTQDKIIIEDFMAKSLARLHKLLNDLGRPMYQPATHPDV